MNRISQNILQSWPFLLGLLLGLYTVVFSILGWDLAYFPGDLGDARFNAYILEHGHQFLTGQKQSLWDAPFMYPEPKVITYSDNLIGTVPLFSLFRSLGYDVLTSFQFWFIALFIANYSSMYAFLKWLFKNRYSAVLGAFLFAFSLALQSQMTHAQMFPRLFVPLSLWLLFLFAKHLKPQYFFLSLFCVVLQFYSGIYLGFLLVIPFGIAFVLIAFQKRKELNDRIKKKSWSGWMVLSVVINFGLLLLLMWPYYERSKYVGINTYESILASIPTLRSYFYSQPGSLIWEGLSNVGADYPAFWDHQLFPGILAILACIVFFVFGVFRKKWRFVGLQFDWRHWTLLVTGILTGLFYIRFSGFSLYQFIHPLPGFGSMRSLTRIINIELLFFSIALSAVSLVVFNRFKSFSPFLFLLLLAILVLDNYYPGENAYRTLKSASNERTQTLINEMRKFPEGSVVSYEPKTQTEPEYVYQIDAMLATQALNLKSVNGYSGTSPKNFHHFWMKMDTPSRKIWFKEKNFQPDTVYVVYGR